MKSIIISSIGIAICIVLLNYDHLQKKFVEQVISHGDQSTARKASDSSFTKHLTKTANITTGMREKKNVTWQSVTASEKVTNSTIPLMEGNNMIELNLEKEKENLFLCTLCASLLF
jgi:hypothetical protein